MSDQTMDQQQRRVFYGLHSLVFIIALLAIVVFANWMGYRHFTRIDMTATRQYALSPQTRKVLANLKRDIRIVMIFRTGTGVGEQQNQVSDLVGEYVRRGNGHVQLQAIDPDYEAAALESFLKEVHQRYADELKAPIDALELASSTIRDVSQFADAHTKLIAASAAALESATPSTRQLTSNVSAYLENLNSRLSLDVVRQTLGELDQSPLPDYAGAATQVKASLRTFQNEMLTPLAAAYRQMADNAAAPDAVKNFALQAIESVRPIANEVAGTLDMLDNLPARDYDDVRDGLRSNPNSVALISKEHITVLALNDVYAPPQAQSGNAPPAMRFKGEEVITGSLISLTLDNKPMIVFVNCSQQPAIGPGGQYTAVAQMLRNMNFDVTEWAVAGQRTPWGQQPPRPEPKPEHEGQTVVYIALPAPEPTPQMPYNPAEAKAAQAVADHLAKGQPALVFTGFSRMAQFGASGGSTVEMLSPFGIEAQNDRPILLAMFADGTARPTSFQVTRRWPEHHAIGKAVQGLPGVLTDSVPLIVKPVEGTNIKTWPLIETASGTWAETDLQSPAPPTADKPKTTGPFTVALAATKGDVRLVVIADTTFANDRITTNADTMLRPEGRGLAEMFGAAYPANAELFVNSVYWLAGLDDMIATTARAQDRRRFEPVSRGAAIALWWLLLAGLPVAILLTGTVVWVVRRK